MVLVLDRGESIARCTRRAHDRHDGPATATAVPDEQERKTAGRRLLELGHDGNSGFKTPTYRMHEFIR
jgi:hypothetical protein